MSLFYVLSFFKKGDTIQGGTLFKGGHYLRKYGILETFCNQIQSSDCKLLPTSKNVQVSGPTEEVQSPFAVCLRNAGLSHQLPYFIKKDPLELFFFMVY
jgi:hypothetical protein